MQGIEEREGGREEGERAKEENEGNLSILSFFARFLVPFPYQTSAT